MEHAVLTDLVFRLKLLEIKKRNKTNKNPAVKNGIFKTRVLPVKAFPQDRHEMPERINFGQQV